MLKMMGCRTEKRGMLCSVRKFSDKFGLFYKILFFIIFHALVSILAFPISAASKESDYISFDFLGQEFDFHLPLGFCVPNSSYKELANLAKEFVNTHMVHIILYDCMDMKASRDPSRWVILMTPKRTLSMKAKKTDRALRSLLARKFETDAKKSGFRQAMREARDIAGRRYHDVFGADANIEQHLEPVETDENGAYLAGTTSLLISGKKQISAAAGVITVARGRVFNNYFYKNYKNLNDILEMVSLAKEETRLFIQNNVE